MPQLGIAIATTLGGWLNAYLLWSTLSKRNDFVVDARLRRNVPLMIAASLAMVASLLAASRFLAPYLVPGRGFLVEASALGVEIGVGLAVFAIIILATGVMTFGQLGRMTRGSR